jgi:ABC-2 type transport system permease protein
MSSMTAFAGTPSLVRLALRIDRIRLAVWVLALVGITGASARAVASTYGTPAQIASYSRNLGSSPATVATSGPPVALDQIGGIVVFETSLTVLIGVALMAALTVVRHTRADEEAGRTELLASTVVGRHADTTAALLVASGASVLVGLGVALSVLGPDFPALAAALYGASVAAIGICFAAVATVAAQLMSQSRAATGTTLAVLALAFGLRAIGDVRGSGLSWLSPIGWSQQIRLFDGDRWWPLLISLLVSGVLLGAAAWLTTRRDVGSGVLADRRGPARASRLLSSPLGLAWRLQRGTVLAWAVGLALLGVVFGSVAEQLEDLVADNPTLEEYFAQTGGSITDAYFAVALLFMGLGAAGFAVASTLRVHGEEVSGRVGPVLAAAVSRRRLLLESLVVTVGGAVVLLTAGGLGIAVADALVRDDWSSVVRLASLAWVQLPAVLVLVGVAVLLTGWATRATALAWVAVGFAVVVGWLGGLLRTPSWISGLSPFEHLPQVPVDEVRVAPLALLTLLAALLVAVGEAGFRRRDID